MDIKNERIRTFCEKCRQPVCICNGKYVPEGFLPEYKNKLKQEAIEFGKWLAERYFFGQWIIYSLEELYNKFKQEPK